MDKFELEVCIESVESALAAKRGGATRLEVCENLVIGGTTPGPWLYEAIRENCDLKMHMLIRPRYGDFLYSDYEFDIIKKTVKMYRQCGADGIVIGILKKDGSLDRERLEVLMECAGDMRVTLHRAFDVCRDPFAAMQTAIDLGVNTILTSGQQRTAAEGSELITELVKRSRNQIEIMAGSGVNADVIAPLYQQSGTTAYHMSGRKMFESEMEYRHAKVSMGIPAISEYECSMTDEVSIRCARRVLEKL